MTSDELNALADKWQGFAAEEAAMARDETKFYRAREWASNANAMFCVAEHLRLAAFCAAQGIEAGTDETAQPVRPEGQEPGPKDAPQ